MNSQQLREHLESALKGLQDGSMDIEKAKAVGEISQVAINLAKVEVDFVRANGGGNSAFFADALIGKAAAKQITKTPTGTLIRDGNSTIHRLVG